MFFLLIPEPKMPRYGLIIGAQAVVIKALETPLKVII